MPHPQTRRPRLMAALVLSCGCPLVSALTVASPTSRAVFEPSPNQRGMMAAAHAAFESAVELTTHARNGGGGLSAEVPRLLRDAFNADFECSLASVKHVQNVTCKRPDDNVCGAQCFDDSLLTLPLQDGRACHGGDCSCACSRIELPAFATPEEAICFRNCVDSLMPSEHEHPHHNLYLMSCAAAGDVRATLTFIRLIERMRRVIAHEYGLNLARVVPRQAFVSRISGSAERQMVHADESSHDTFHYSSVLYLSSQGVDFHGGTFSFSDPPADARGERVLRSVVPSTGSAVAFSSGWENIHFGA